MHYKIREFTLTQRIEFLILEYLTFPSARRLIRNQNSDSAGVYRIQSSRPLLIEVYEVPQTLTMTRKADGVEIDWESDILQRSLLIDGPQKDVKSGGKRRLFLRPSQPLRVLPCESGLTAAF